MRNNGVVISSMLLLYGVIYRTIRTLKVRKVRNRKRVPRASSEL